jgi:hypothetical protein
MKYLKLFEAFDANIISKVTKFISKKVDKNSSARFLSDLKRIIDRYDIPISKIANEDLVYLKSNKALEIKPKEVDNKWGVYAIKYWFSVSNGYKGYSGIGNENINYTSHKDGLSKSKFSSTEMGYISDNLGIKTGKLVEIDRDKYRQELNHGDLVVGMFCDYVSLNKIALAKIIIEDEYVYAFQNVSSGGEPGRDYTNLIQGADGDINPLFIYSWSLDHIDNPGRDHMKLHKYIENDEDLIFEGDSYSLESTESVYDFNLPFDGQYLTNWDSGNITEDQIEDSDFCIVVYIDNLIKKTKSVVSTKQDRIETKQGALKLMTDEEIKRINIDRYFTEISKKMGLSKETSELKDLQKVIKRSLTMKCSFFSIFRDEPSSSHVLNFIDDVRYFIKDNDEYYLDRAINRFRKLSEITTELNKNYQKSDSKFRSLEKSEQLEEVYDILLKIGDDINSWVGSKNIDTLGEMKFIYHMISLIRNIINDTDIRPKNLDGFISNFKYYDGMSDRVHYLSSIDLSEDIKKLEFMRKKIKPILA